ncbi:MAG: FtsX-like permease family protein [Microthrixaceae bacterium]
MNVAVTELRRRPGRFVTATIILTLLATLLLLLGGLLDGLLNGATSAVAGQRGDVIVYSSTAEQSFLRSRITPEQRAQVEAVDGVKAVGGLGVVQLGARVPGNADRDLADVALFGYEIAPVGVPADPPATGTAYADRTLEAEGIKEGMTVEVGPARTPVEIVGWVDGLVYSGQGTLWASADTWRATVNANRPDAGVGDGVVQALVVQADPGVSPARLTAAIDEATDGSTDSLTRSDAVEAIPGVKEQRGTFNQIIGVTLVIAVVVVALFFALLTVERTGLYGVLKAIGATSGRLFVGVVLQAVVVTAIAAAIGSALAVVLDVVIPPGSIPYTLLPGRVVSSVVFLLVAAVVGCAFSLRRVLRIDPASAIGSAS